MTDTNVKQTALAWHEAGYCILPAADDGTKKPGVGSWDAYKTRRPDRASLNRWLAKAPDGIGMVCGAVSGNVEMLELEAAAADRLPTFLQAVADAEADYSEPVGTSIMGALGTYMERTPTGGYHFLYRVDGPVAGNTKLASRPHTPDENSPTRRQTLLETRGEGGWTVLAPSGGATHPSGGAWEILSGRPGVLATITEGQRDLLHAIAASFDEMPPPAPQTVSEQHRGLGQGADSRTPGEDFSERTTWADLLTSHGWRRIYGRGEVTYWQRPGKTDRTISASTGKYGDWLYVFSTSTEFEPERTYTKFGAYALLEHGGNHSAAASELRRRGYGRPAPAAERKLTVVRGEESSSPVIEGNTVRKPEQVEVVAGFSDEGNALLLAEVVKGRVLYNPERRLLLTWDGTRWKWGVREDLTPLVVPYRQMIHSIRPGADKAAAAWQAKSLEWGRCEKAIKFTKADPKVQVRVADLDSARWELNTPGGVYDLHTLEIQPPSPDALHTKLAGFAPDLNTMPERFLHFLAQTFQNAAEPARMIEFIQRLAGHSVIGEVRWHVLPFLYGTGQNGKGVLMEIFLRVLGEYASTAPSDLLLEGGKDVNAIKADLAGLRLVMCSEVSPTAKFHEERVKSLTGGDPVDGRRLYENFVNFMPSHQIWMMGNHEPALTMGGDAIFRRLRKVNFGYTVPESQQVPGLAGQIVDEEGPAILGWMLRGVPLQTDGLHEPAEVMAATATYAQEEDHLASFMEECLAVGGGETRRETMESVGRAYRIWCERNGEKAISTNMFGREMKRRGLGEAKSNGRKLYTNVTHKLAQVQIEDDTVPTQTRIGTDDNRYR